MEFIIGYAAIGAIILSAYYGNLLKQKDLKKACGNFANIYYDLINKFYNNPILVTLSVDDEGALLPMENQPIVLQEIYSKAKSHGDIKDYYARLNDSFEELRKLIGKSARNDRHYLFPLFEVLNVTAAFCAGIEDYSVLNDTAFINNFNIFLNNQDKIKVILSDRMLPITAKK